MSDEEILKIYDGLRVADVSDGLDVVGLRDQCIMDQKIVALWKDIENFSHRFCRIVVTARYVPTNHVIKNPMNPEDYKKWEGNWYDKISAETYTNALKKGSVVVLDVQGDGDTGSIGSNNAIY